MSERGAVICGFWDEPAKLAGLAWDLGAPGGLLWSDGELSAASAEIDGGGEGVRFRLDAGGDAYEAELSPLPAEAPLQGDEGSPPGEPSAAPASVTVRLGGDNGRTLQAAGHLTRWRGSPFGNAALLRHLAVPAADGSVLIVVGTGAGGTPHGEESTSAWLIDAQGSASPYPEALLSTQYDEAGLQSRAGLELWSADEEAPPMRAAGTRLGDPPEPRHGVSAALLRSSAEGTPGLGSYLIWRG
ncbi:MAG: hypothetical protein ACXWZM_10050 [Solirubrobacterales bacterium]